MPDFAHVIPGEMVRRTAELENAMRDAARAYQQSGPRVGFDVARGETNAGVVLVKNSSGAQVTRFGILGIDRPIILPSSNLPEFQSRVMLSCIKPAAVHVVRFVVLLDPLPIDQIGRAVASGVVQCQINVTDALHTFAKAKAGDTTNLTSDGFTGAPILWGEAGTGIKWAVIRLEGKTGDSGVGQTTAPITAGDLGVVTEYKWVAGVWTDTGQTRTMRNTSDQTIATGDKVSWFYHSASNQYLCATLNPLKDTIGIGQTTVAIAAGASGNVNMYNWIGAVFTNTFVVQTMRNTSGVSIGSGKKVSWMYHVGSAQYLCAPLEC